MIVVMVVMSERLEKRPGATPTTFLPPIFTRIASIYVFCVSPPPPRENALWGLYIVVFRSSWAVWDEDGRHQRSEVQTNLGGTPGQGPRPHGLVWASWLPLLTSCALEGSRDINARKIPGQIKFGKILETSKYTKQGFPILQSYNQNKGDRWKIPINQCKTWF
jgi:hypothetical protein